MEDHTLELQVTLWRRTLQKKTEPGVWAQWQRAWYGTWSNTAMLTLDNVP